MANKTWQLLKALAGIIMFLVGIGGIRGDIDQWTKWLHIGHFNLGDVFWALLIGVGFLLLLLNLVVLIPYSTWQSWFRRIPRRLQGLITSLAWIRPTGDKTTAFYSTRTSMEEKYGGIRGELGDAQQAVWAAWHAGTLAQTLPKEYRDKVKRLILLDPDQVRLDQYVGTKENLTAAKSPLDIRTATALFGEPHKDGSKTEIRWFSGPYNLITIIDPETKKARARVEVYFYAESDKRQNYLIYERDNKEAYAEIVATFERMWEHSQWSRIPPDDKQLALIPTEATDQAKDSSVGTERRYYGFTSRQGSLSRLWLDR